MPTILNNTNRIFSLILFDTSWILFITGQKFFLVRAYFLTIANDVFCTAQMFYKLPSLHLSNVPGDFCSFQPIKSFPPGTGKNLQCNEHRNPRRVFRVDFNNNRFSHKCAPNDAHTSYRSKERSRENSFHPAAIESMVLRFCAHFAFPLHETCQKHWQILHSTWLAYFKGKISFSSFRTHFASELFAPARHRRP